MMDAKQYALRIEDRLIHRLETADRRAVGMAQPVAFWRCVIRSLLAHADAITVRIPADSMLRYRALAEADRCRRHAETLAETLRGAR